MNSVQRTVGSHRSKAVLYRSAKSNQLTPTAYVVTGWAMRAQSMVLTDRILLYYQGVLLLVIPSCHKPFLKHLAIPRPENLCVEPFHSQS